jgi:methylated-DNA-[protein]-cysteine S-methyltransferase
VSGRSPRYSALYRSPLGDIGIVAEGHTLEIVLRPEAPFTLAPRPSPLARRVVALLRGYFQNPRRRMDLPLAPAGTPFQQRVWSAIRAIPPGQVRSYGELARKLQTSSRAVGQACRANPLPLLIPCHRVVAARGFGGFMGAEAALDVKRWLLAHEGVLRNH